MGGEVKYMVTGSAPINDEVKNFFRCCMGCQMLEGYGQTETCALGTVSNFDDPTCGHVGGPSVNIEYRLEDIPDMNYLSTDKDESGNPAPRGEICFRGPSIIPGYYKMEKKSKEAI